MCSRCIASTIWMKILNLEFLPTNFWWYTFSFKWAKIFRLNKIYCLQQPYSFSSADDLNWNLYVCLQIMFAHREENGKKICKPQQKPFWMRYILWLWYSLASVFVFKLNQDLADLFEHKQMRCLNTAILWRYPRWFPMSWTLTLYDIFDLFV